MDYAEAGVNISLADQAKQRIRRLASRTDGGDTKLKIAVAAGIHSTVGGDLVNHCVNDILTLGAEPLFFLDYLAMSKMDPNVVEQVVEGISRACHTAGCALIGGETAEMPGFYAPGEYDLAGFIVGAVERERLLTGAKIRPRGVLIGLPSTGLHTNGYSLARKLLFDVAGHGPSTRLNDLESTIADELLKLHRSYLKPLRALDDAGVLKGAAHITGGGITDNTPRILPQGLGVRIDRGSWPVLPIFELLRRIGDIPEQDWRRTFNLGIGMIFVVSPRKLAEAGKLLDKM